MALNKYMHKRNVYRNFKPNFKQLASTFPFFKEVTQEDEAGRVIVNFREPRHLAALSRALLLKDFDLDVDIPLNRLIPTVPLRLNYILWLEDLIANIQHAASGVTVLDVGVGASCIYPLLGCKKNGWKFFGTETDAKNYQLASENVKRNSLQEKIHLLQIDENACSLDAVLNSDSIVVPYLTAVMANPPFYCDQSDAIGTATSRSITRPAPKTTTSGTRIECQTKGGEVMYCMRLARESVKYATRVGVFTVMLGKKRSVVPFKRILRKLSVPKVSVYELCQGRIMRWGVAWTFLPHMDFPVSEFQRLRKLERPPLSYVLPAEVSCLSSYTAEGLLDWLRQEFRQLKMKVLDQKNRAEIGGIHLSISATENTWTHCRRKRREARRLGLPDNRSDEPLDSAVEMECSSTLKRPADAVTEVEGSDTAANCKRPRVEEPCVEGEAWMDEDGTDENKHILVNPAELIILANVYVDQTLDPASNADESDEDANGRSVRLVLKIAFLDGSCREAANQILCYLKNRLR